MYVTNKMHKIFVIRLYFQYTLYMFRTVSVHLQEQFFYELNVVSAHTKYDVQLIKRLLLKMDRYSPKHVERIFKIKSNHKKKTLCILLVYIHIAK